MRKLTRLLITGIPLAVTVGFVPGSLTTASAVTTTHFNFTEPGVSSVSVTNFTCDNSGGPTITLGKHLNLGGHLSQLDLRNNVQGTHEYADVGSIVLALKDATPEDDTIGPLSKGGPTGIGGNPFVYYQNDGDSVDQAFYVGRCVQNGKIGVKNGAYSPNFNKGPFVSNFNLGAFSNIDITSVCTNKGSALNVGSSTSDGDVTGHLTFTNTFLGNVHSQHMDASSVLASLTINLHHGGEVKKNGSLPNGAGGNPLVYLGTGPDTNGVDAGGLSISNVNVTSVGEKLGVLDAGQSQPGQLLGRCNKI